MSQLTGTQFQRLHAALLDAFDQAELAQMVRLEMDQNLDRIAGGGALTEVVFNLMQWAQRHGRVGDLVRAAQQQRPHSSAFQALAAELEGPPAERQSSPGAAEQTEPMAAPGGITVGKVEAANVGESQTIDQRGSTFNLGDRAEVNTGGGAFIAGNVTVGSGDFVGRDKVMGDQISVGDVSGTGVAIGRGASASVQQGAGGESADQLRLVGALASLMDAVRRSGADAATQAAAAQQIEALTQELAKGKGADDARVAGALDGLAKLAPDAAAVIVSAFDAPQLAALAGPVTQFVLGQLRRSQT